MYDSYHDCGGSMYLSPDPFSFGSIGGMFCDAAMDRDLTEQYYGEVPCI